MARTGALDAIAGSICTYEQKANHLVFKITYQYLMDNLDENAKAFYNWCLTYHSSDKNSEFIQCFFVKYGNPYGCKEPVAWACVNASACAIATMREVFDTQGH